jgi:hypothetical protein
MAQKAKFEDTMQNALDAFRFIRNLGKSAAEGLATLAVPAMLDTADRMVIEIEAAMAEKPESTATPAENS